jgi:Plasmid pRiA4b ORF-3-like protein
MQFKVWMLGLSPMVWRRVLVPADFTLRQPHGVIQVAMGWERIHLFQFQLRAIRYGSWEVVARSPSDSDGRPASFSTAWRRQTGAD